MIANGCSDTYILYNVIYVAAGLKEYNEMITLKTISLYEFKLCASCRASFGLHIVLLLFVSCQMSFDFHSVLLVFVLSK